MFKQEMPHVFYREQSNPDYFFHHTKPLEMFACELCNFNTPLKVDLIEHVRVFHERKDVNGELTKILKCYPCKNCDFKTHSLVVLAKHISACVTVLSNQRKTKHTSTCVTVSNNPYKEAKNENSTDDQWYELATPAGAKWFKCRHCVLITREIGDMQSHTLSEHEDGINWFKCQQCSYKSKTKRNLLNHMRAKHTKVEKKQIPKNATIGDGDWYELKTPGGVNWFKCKHCVLITKEVIDVKNHVLLEHVDAEDVDWFSCTQCAFRSKLKSDLRRHIMRFHTKTEDLPLDNEKWYELRTPGGVKWLKCKRCVLITKEIADMETHVLLEHDADRFKFKCSQCMFATTQSRGLRRHVTVKHKDFQHDG